jgi:hypothetical protein
MRWFVAWALAGALCAFSVLSMGVGVFVLPLALIALFWVGRLSIPASAPPGSSVSCGGLDPRPWAFAGLALSGTALIGYGFARKR